MSDEDTIRIAREVPGEELTPEEFAEMEEKARAHERQEQSKQANTLLVTLEEWRRTLPEDVTAQDVKDKLDEIIEDFESLIISIGFLRRPSNVQNDGEVPF